MIFTPHILVSAALAAKLGPLGAAMALIVHFLMDSLPHYEYNVSGLQGKIGKKYLFSLGKVTFDLLFGLALVALIISSHSDINIILLGIFIGILPDGLLFLHWQNPKNPIFKYISRFHDYCHWPKKKSGALGLIVEAAITFLGLIALMSA